jgi:hypothetical protein
VKMNSPPQSAQVNSRSTNSITASPVLRDRRIAQRGPRTKTLRAIKPVLVCTTWISGARDRRIAECCTTACSENETRTSLRAR